MTDQAIAESGKPATPYLKLSGDGRPYLQGSRCKQCEAIYIGTRVNCANCAARDAIEPITLGTRGRLYNYTVVHRSYPGIKVPFISAIVELDEGGTLKGNLIDLDPASPELAFGLPVEVVFRGAEIANPNAKGFISHFFVPAKEPSKS